MPIIDYDASRSALQKRLADVETRLLNGQEPKLAAALAPHFSTVFESKTTAYREVLLGCILARMSDRSIDIRKPYVNQGRDAYNGRTLDERVVNPFLREARIPASTGPYLNVFRRSVVFDENTRAGLKDKNGYDSFLAILKYLSVRDDMSALNEILEYTLYKFVQLRDAAKIPLIRLQRISLEQYRVLIEGLLSAQTGGRFAVMLTEATFRAIKETYGLDWTIEVQGINVADKSAGAGGDITIRKGTTTLLAVEITERPLERSRVVATFQAKIAPNGIDDYLFILRDPVDELVLQQARQYFSQGHEINFLEIQNWIRVVLSTLGKSGREAFSRALLEMLDARNVPTSLKVAWNIQIASITDT